MMLLLRIVSFCLFLLVPVVWAIDFYPGIGQLPPSLVKSAGSLTTNALVLGAGTTDTKVAAGLTTDGVSKLTLGVAGTSVGSVDFKNVTSGTMTLAPVTGALGTVTVLIPAANDTLVNLTSTQTLSGKKLTTPTIEGNLTWSSGGPVIPNSTVAALGTATAGLTKRVTDNIQGLWVANGTVWYPLNRGCLNAAEFGVKADDGLDDTAGFNSMFDRARSLLAGADERPVCMDVPQGQYHVSSINATSLRGRGWVLYLNGAEIIGNVAGKVVLDFLHSRTGTIIGGSIRGDTTNVPRIGIQAGYGQNGTSSGKLNFLGVYTFGHFTLAALYLGGAEEVVTQGGQFRNSLGTSTSYSLIHDSANYWGRRSDYLAGGGAFDLIAIPVTNITNANPGVVTATAHGFSNGDIVRFLDVGGMTQVNNTWFTVAGATANTFQLSGIDTTAFGAYTSGGFVALLSTGSFVQVSHINSGFFKNVGGPAVWLGWSGNRWRFDNSYVYSVDNKAVVIHLNSNTVANGGSGGIYVQQLYLDVTCEGTTITHCIYFNVEGTVGNINLEGYLYRDHGPQSTIALIGTNSTTPVINLIGSEIDVALFPAAAVLFSETSKFVMTGQIKTRHGSGFSGMPNNFSGLLEVEDANTNALGAGSYEINSQRLTGSNIAYRILKGELRVKGGTGTIADDGLDDQTETRITNQLVLTADARSGNLVLADDTAGSFSVPGIAPAALLLLSSDSGTGPQGVFWVRASASPVITPLTTLAANVVTQTGVLTGTTGVDGNITVSTHTDGKVYIENRRGVSLTFGLLFTSGT